MPRVYTDRRREAAPVDAPDPTPGARGDVIPQAGDLGAHFRPRFAAMRERSLFLSAKLIPQILRSEALGIFAEDLRERAVAFFAV